MLCLKVDLSLSFMSLCHCLSVDLSPSVTRAPPQGLHEHHSRFQIPIIGIAMGERGLISRLLSPKFNGYLTYAALEAGAISAPGQPTAKDLLDLYNFRLIKPDTKVYGIIGKPVGHSKSPLLFNESFKKDEGCLQNTDEELLIKVPGSAYSGAINGVTRTDKHDESANA